MVEGRTKSGFVYTIEDDALDDYELVEAFASIKDDDSEEVVKIAPILLGNEQVKALKEHVRALGGNGRVKLSLMMVEIVDILGNKDIKKS